MKENSGLDYKRQEWHAVFGEVTIGRFSKEAAAHRAWKEHCGKEFNKLCKNISPVEPGFIAGPRRNVD